MTVLQPINATHPWVQWVSEQFSLEEDHNQNPLFSYLKSSMNSELAVNEPDDQI